jgi:hypothetical protein
MKINSLMADNFQRLNLLDVDMNVNTVHLFAGDNEAGKTSIQDAIRFVLLGETTRVGKTNIERKLLIRDGAKNGSVGIVIDNVLINRDIKTGKPQTEQMDNYVAQLPKNLPYLLNAQQFATRKPDERRSFLFALTDTKIDRDNIARRMAVKGVSEACIERIKPNLRNGFKSAHTEAVKLGTSARAEWKGLTGEVYGSVKAETWKPVLPEGFDPQALLDREAELIALNEQLASKNIAKGGVVSKIDEAKKELDAHGDVGPFDAKALTDKLERIPLTESVLKAGETKKGMLNAQLANARERVPVPCCECGALLRVQFSGSEVKVEPYEPMSEKDMQKLQAAIIQQAEDNSDAGKQLDKMREGAAAMQRLEAIAQGGSSKFTNAEIKDMDAALDSLNSEIYDMDQNQAAINTVVVDLRTAANQVRDAKKTEARAHALHESVQEWEKCYSVLAPDGIPAEILADALKPVNDRLRSASMQTGWPQVSIDPAMEIMADGRRYSLLSESARWRADAAVADAIAHLSGLKLMLLDRIDVLDISNRHSLMKWVHSIMGDYDSILLFGTLKALPKGLPPGMVAHWIENGEIREAS